MGGKFDPRVSWRSGDFTEGDSFQHRQHAGRTRAVARTVAAEATGAVRDGDSTGQQGCAQGQWCHAATRDSEGTWHPAQTYQAYCPACRGRIATCLAELPAASLLMAAQIGERPRTGKAVRVPPGPRLPIRLDIDALVRETAFVLASWHGRVAQVARLSAPRQVTGRRLLEATRDAERVLSPHLDALLALPAGRMIRVARSAVQADAEYGDGTAGLGVLLPSGEVRLRPRLDGADAGREILRLHYRARGLLGEIRPKPELLDGVPCRECEEFTLEQAEPPSDPKIPAKHARCSNCRATMDRRTFDAWVRLYESWSRATPGLVCRRCQKAAAAGLAHSGCAWSGCACRAAGHTAMLRTVTTR